MGCSFHISKISNLPYQQIIAATGITGVEIQGATEAVKGLWPTGTYYFYIHGVSTRTLAVTYTNLTIQITILTAASPEDHMFAVRLAKEIAEYSEQSVTVYDSDSDTGQTVTPTQLMTRYNHQWAEQSAQAYLSVLINRQQQTLQPIFLPGPTRELQLGQRLIQQLLKQPKDFSRQFFHRFRLLNYLETEGLGLARQNKFSEPQSGREVCYSVYREGNAAVIQTTSDAVCLRANNGNALFIPTTKLIALIDTVGTWLSEDILLLPALEDNHWQKLFNRSRRYHIDDLLKPDLNVEPDRPVTSTIAPITPERNSFTLYQLKSTVSTEQWQLILKAPYLVFIVMATSSGRINKKQADAFHRALVRTAQSNHPLMQQVVLESLPYAHVFLSDLLTGKDKPSSLLTSIRELVDCHLNQTSAAAFKMQLCELAKAVTEASTYKVFGFSKSARNERSTLIAIASLLGVIATPT